MLTLITKITQGGLVLSVISRSPTTLFLSQRQYVLDLLSHASMSDYQPTRTPADVGAELSADGNS